MGTKCSSKKKVPLSPLPPPQAPAPPNNYDYPYGCYGAIVVYLEGMHWYTTWQPHYVSKAEPGISATSLCTKFHQVRRNLKELGFQSLFVRGESVNTSMDSSTGRVCMFLDEYYEAPRRQGEVDLNELVAQHPMYSNVKKLLCLEGPKSLPFDEDGNFLGDSTDCSLDDDVDEA
ncbi:hypothetical protein RND71_009697 [Anisodus tanguticus]|uniref:Uncharacterized protein n=1 Tax=Anisodus tanguticus TaxID=243964 RepID=A0AAE1VIF1_9SOLA|nr:hypothetical protein RND71_009697 [Anisodus tanguticus]